MTSVDTIRQLIKGYELAYRRELRRQMSLSLGVHEVLPYHLKGANETTAMLGRDGVVVIHRDALADSFEFVHRPKQTVGEILLEQGVGELDKPEHEPPEAFRMSGPTWIMEWGEERPASKEFGWKDVEIIPKSDIKERTEEAGKTQAEQDVQTFVSARLMGLPQGQVAETRDKVIADLEFAINEFEKVVEVHANDEKMIQLFLTSKRNQILLDPSARSVRPHVKLAEKYVPDFVVEASKEQYVLVEIERPALPLLNAKGRPRAELIHAQQQVEDWFEWISRHSEYARTLIPGISEPKGWVVMGRRSSIPPKYKNVIARGNAESRRITTMTYDDLLDRAKQHLQNLRGL